MTSFKALHRLACDAIETTLDLVLIGTKLRYDEFKHFGVDFADVDEVREYDAKQGASVSGERELVKELGISCNDTVLEYGCGTGAFVVAAAQQCHKVIAVDISKAMLDFVRSQSSCVRRDT